MEVKEVVLCPTKAGKGYKLVVNGVWLYTSRGEFSRIFKGGGCTFRIIGEDKPIKEKEINTDEDLLDNIMNKFV